MAILQVARMGNPVLRQITAAVAPDELACDDFQAFLDDLYESMLEEDGVGLAAPQVHRSQRVVVIQLDPDEEPIFLINPVVRPITEAQTWGYEGCLSVPELRGRVLRWVDVRVDALDRDGQPLVFEAHNWAARVVQHECDHLDGVLYVDRAQVGSLAFLKEYRRFGPPVRGDDDDDAEADDEE
ncbi:MAG: peptide deformylase [Myxococcales bacterium]|nr:peptide deformylase [Myxococcales bacterium]